jgi:hypothetical protein
MNDRIAHNVAWASAHALLDLIGHNYRKEQQRELFAKFYNASRAVIESYCAQSDRQMKRIAPSKN